MFKKMIIALAVTTALASPAFAFDFNAAIGAGQIQGGNIGGSSAQSGIVGGSAFNGATFGIVGNQSVSNAATQSTMVLGSNGMVGTTLNQHTNTSVSGLVSGSLGNSFNAGLASGNAASVGMGTFQGGFGSLNVHLNP